MSTAAPSRRSGASAAHPLLRALERFVLPNVCVACERPVGRRRPDALLCTPCLARMEAVTGGCARCAQPLPPIGPCRFCADWPAALQWVRSAVWLGEEARQAVHHLKYDGLRALGTEIAVRIARAVPRPDKALLVPIPLARHRLRERGFNQAEVLADALGAAWRLPVAPSLLVRRRETRSQTTLDPERRRENVRDAFVARPPRSMGERRDAVPDGESGGSAAVILLDDVLTTGATLCSAAAALERAGWRSVGAVTFGRALPYAARATAGAPAAHDPGLRDDGHSRVAR